MAIFLYESLPEVFETKTDHLIGYERTEYHCKNCGGHHGHIFDDGPKPTGKDIVITECAWFFRKKNDYKIYQFFYWSYLVLFNNKNSINFQ